MGNLIRVAELAEVAPGTSRTVLVNGARVAFHNVDGRIFATADACPDQGYSLGSYGTLTGEIVTCAFHFWEFNVRTGEPTDGMGEQLDTYPVTVIQDGIYLEAPPSGVQTSPPEAHSGFQC